MDYRLRIWAAGHGPGIAITAQEYSNIVSAMQRIYLARDIEEKLDLVLGNYFEYERELLVLALRDSLFKSGEDHWFSSDTNLLDRRVINLLSAARTYSDQVSHAMSRYFGSGQLSKPDVEALFKAEYDQHLEYRVAEGLRNHAQHRGLPIHRLTRAAGWEDHETPRERLRYSLVPSISVDELGDEGGFKASVLAELRATGKSSFPLTPILRRYVESITIVHQAVRSLLSDQVERDHQTLRRTLERAKAELGASDAALACTVSDDADEVKERHYVNDRSWVRRQSLMVKNRDFKHLSRRYVSAEYPDQAS